MRQVDPEQSARYGVLRRERVATDELQADHRAFVDGQMTKENGAASRLSRLAARTPSGDAVYVLPGRVGRRRDPGVDAAWRLSVSAPARRAT